MSGRAKAPMFAYEVETKVRALQATSLERGTPLFSDFTLFRSFFNPQKIITISPASLI